MKYFIYVDDIRTNDSFYKSLPNYNEWKIIIARNYQDAIRFLRECSDGSIIIDLDHDLGFDGILKMERSGYDICKYIVENQIPITAFHIHSMNPVGAHNMRSLLTHYGYHEI